MDYPCYCLHQSQFVGLSHCWRDYGTDCRSPWDRVLVRSVVNINCRCAAIHVISKCSCGYAVEATSNIGRKMREYALQLEGICVVEVKDTPEGPEIQRVKQSRIYLIDKNVKHTVGLYLSKFKNSAGRSLEDVIADQSVPLHQMLDDEIERVKIALSWP